MLGALTGELQGGAALAAHTIGAWAPESEGAGILRAAEKANGGVAVGSYTFFRDGRTGANFVIRSTDPAAVAACVAAVTAGVEAAGYAVTDGGSEEHTSELQSLMRNWHAACRLTKQYSTRHPQASHHNKQ